MIPNRLARAALGPVPRRYEGFWQQWQTLHPDFEFTTYTAPQPEVAELPASCPSQRADLIRWQHLYEWGGWWVCWDTQPLASLHTISNHDLVIGAYKDSVNGEFYALAVVGTTPGHPGVKAILDDLLSGNYTPNPISTGPLKATEHLRGRTDITVMAESVFTPVRYGKPQPPVQGYPPDAIATHHWADSWRNERRKYAAQNPYRR